MYRASVILPPHLTRSQVELFNVAFEDKCLAHATMRKDNNDLSSWVLEWYFEQKPEEITLNTSLSIGFELCGITNNESIGNSWSIEKVPDDIDWLEHSYKQFQPFSIGEFFIYGSHYDGAPPENQIGLQIDAATAFGSGEHGTTAGCLQAMQDLKKQGVCPWNVLDMGTGSGILAIAAYKLWKTPILAIDNDPESIAVTTNHIKENHITPSPQSILCKVNDGFDGEYIMKRGPFDLIIANILASTLIDMAKDLVNVVDENGYLILSGILNEQVQGVLDAYQPLGLTLQKTYDIGEWSSLVLHNTGP